MNNYYASADLEYILDQIRSEKRTGVKRAR